MSDTASLLSPFISSFLAATLLPGGSEAALFAVLKAYPETLWYALIIASIGNTLGGMVTFDMGWLLPQRRGGGKAAGHPPAYSSRVQTQQLKHVEKLRPRHGGAEPSGAGVAASHLLPQTAGFASNVSKVRRYGTPALLLAWVPLIGDALCLAAGWLMLNPWQAMLFMAIGKFSRYGLIALAIT
jgi:membrane protein YqaA with SNARE-associated domain